MKKIFMFGVMLVAASMAANAEMKWRIDMSDQPANLKGHWQEISDHETWGQMQCQPGGFDCHRYDWLTWWYTVVPEPDPNPQGGPTIYGSGSFPTSYDETNGYY